MKKSHLLSLTLASSMLLAGQAFSFQSVEMQSGLSSFTNAATESGDITVNDPRTHGEFRPRLFGYLSMTTLSTPQGKQIHWFSNATERGAAQLWGSPILGWPEGKTLQEMDQALKSFVDSNKAVFKVSSKELAIDKRRTQFSGPFRYVTYQRFKMIEGQAYPVSSAFVTFRFKYNRLIQITNYTYGEIGPVEAPSVSAEEALEAVKADVAFQESGDRVSGRVRAELMPFYAGKNGVQFRFVYKVDVRKKRPKGFWKYSISALDGSIAQIVNGFETSGVFAGDVFERLPVGSPAAAAIPEAMVYSGDQKELTDDQGNFSLDGSSVMGQLFGKRAFVKVKGSEKVESAIDNSGNIHFPAGNFIGESMAFFHVGKVSAWVRQFIKNAPMLGRRPGEQPYDFLNSPITVNTRMNDERMPECNAWYDTEERNLNFLEEGPRCRGSALFSDIVYHEWGHALDDALGGIQDGAFSEGVGDLNSYFMTHDPRIGPGFIKAKADPIRDISNLKKYPQDRHRDPHLESLIFSGAWYDFIQAMKEAKGAEAGRMKAAEIFYKHLVSTDSYMDSYQGALVVDDDDGDLGNCTPHMCLLNAAFTRHGLASADPRCGKDTMESAEGALPACKETTILNN